MVKDALCATKTQMDMRVEVYTQLHQGLKITSVWTVF